jgi:hypothetical protein
VLRNRGGSSFALTENKEDDVRARLMFMLIVALTGDAAECAAASFAARLGGVRIRNRKMGIRQLPLYGSRMSDGVSQS